jgi:hypothetical protein
LEVIESNHLKSIYFLLRKIILKLKKILKNFQDLQNEINDKNKQIVNQISNKRNLKLKNILDDLITMLSNYNLVH